MSDFDHLVEVSGEDGEFRKAMSLCDKANNGLTFSLDALFGPNEVDGFDASCNTCGNFQRKPMDAEERKTRNIFGMPGTCGLDGSAVVAWQRGQYDGFNHAGCYVNRRTGKRPHECCVPDAGSAS